MSLSGGMDSTALLLHLLSDGFEVKALSFDYGQKHKIEIQKAAKNIEYLADNGIYVKHKIVDLESAMGVFHSALTTKDFEVPEGYYEEANMINTVVPNRNMIFTSIVLGYALSIAIKHDQDVTISLGVHSGDHEIYPDCRSEFFVKLFEAFTLGNWSAEKLSLYLPYIDGDKYTILQDAEDSIEAIELEYEVDLNFNTIFHNTNTSYNPDSAGRASGTSGADVERILAFHKLGRQDPVDYQKPWSEVLANALKVESDFTNGQV